MSADLHHVYDFVQAAILRIGADDKIGAARQAMAEDGVTDNYRGRNPIAGVTFVDRLRARDAVERQMQRWSSEIAAVVKPAIRSGLSHSFR